MIEAAALTPRVPIVMFDGGIADLDRLQPDDIDFAHIASALSKIIRWSGRHQGAGFSVAQHSVMGADALFAESGDPVLAGYFLLHDGHEYLFGDFARPSALFVETFIEPVLAERGFVGDAARGVIAEAVRRAKAALDRPIHAAANLPPIEAMPLYQRKVAEMDERMCFAEAQALYGSRGSIPLVQCDLPPPRLTAALKPWGAMKAEEAWLERLDRCLGIPVRPL